MKCLKCNTEIPENFKFCPECGSNISSMSGQSGVDAYSRTSSQVCFFNLHLLELLIFYACKAKIIGLKREYCKLF